MLQLFVSIFAHSKTLGSVIDKVKLRSPAGVFSAVLDFALFVCLALSSNRGWVLDVIKWLWAEGSSYDTLEQRRFGEPI